ncbi:hypothetical protein N9917_04645, partial [Deltaproteobacteria bacterium]|nr:hypothetical protein [Deltaproteobacteria bacterium]
AEQADPEMAQQLQTMIRLSKGTTGSLSEQAKALDAMGPGGKLATMITGGLGGKAISEMSALELAAFEQYAGVSGEQLVELRRVDASLRGQHERLKEIKEAYEKPDADKEGLAEEFKALGGDMEVLDNGKPLGDISKYIQSQGEMLAQAMDVPASAELAMAEAIGTNTLSIMNTMENSMVYLLEQLVWINQGIWDASLGIVGGVSDFKASTIKSLETGVEKANDQIAVQEAALAEAVKAESMTQGGSAEQAAAQAKMEEIAVLLKETKAIKGDFEADLEGARGMGNAGLLAAGVGGMAVSGGEILTEDVMGNLQEPVTRAMGGALDAVGIEHNDTEQAVKDGEAFWDDALDGATAIAGLFSVGRAYKRGSEGTGLDSTVISEETLKAARDQITAEEKAAKEAQKEAGSLGDDVEDLPKDIAKAMTEEQLKAKLQALGVGDKGMDKAITALQKGDYSATGTGLTKESIGKLKASMGITADTGPDGGDKAVDILSDGSPLQDFIWRAGQGARSISSPVPPVMMFSEGSPVAQWTSPVVAVGRPTTTRSTSVVVTPRCFTRN